MKRALTADQKAGKLRLFNEKIEVLRQGRFVPQVFQPDHRVSLHFGHDRPLTTEKCGADQEAVLALATTLRFFVQERDGVNLDQIAGLYESLPVEDRAKTSARVAADGLKRYLDSPSGMGLDGENLTNRRIFEVFMYGGIAHANDDKRPEYEKWIRSPIAQVLQWHFEDIAAHLVQIIVSFYEMNQRTIAFIESTAKASSLSLNPK
jgi:hypothetical protein